jgi:hypothetical protein
LRNVCRVCDLSGPISWWTVDSATKYPVGLE